MVSFFTASLVADTFDDDFILDFAKFSSRMWYCKFLQALVLTGTLANSVLGVFAVTGDLLERASILNCVLTADRQSALLRMSWGYELNSIMLIPVLDSFKYSKINLHHN